MKKLVFISHNILGREVLSELLSAMKKESLDLKVELVITRKSTERLSDQVSFVELCIENGVPCFETPNIKSDTALIAKVKSIKPDFLFVFGWSQLIPEEVMSSAGLCLGSHPTLLPKNRGNAAIPWTIILDEKRSGVTLFELKGDVDSGDIAAQKAFTISPRETSTTLYSKVVETTKELTIQILPLLIKGALRLKPQKGVPTYLGRRIPKDSLINWRSDSQTVDRHIRAASAPYPESYSYIWKKGKLVRVEILSSEPIAKDDDGGRYRGVPGSVVDIRFEGVMIMCGKETTIRIRKLLVDGTLYDAKAFLSRTDRFEADMDDNLTDMIIKESMREKTGEGRKQR